MLAGRPIAGLIPGAVCTALPRSPRFPEAAGAQLCCPPGSWGLVLAGSCPTTTPQYRVGCGELGRGCLSTSLCSLPLACPAGTPAPLCGQPVPAQLVAHQAPGQPAVRGSQREANTSPAPLRCLTRTGGSIARCPRQRVVNNVGTHSVVREGGHSPPKPCGSVPLLSKRSVLRSASSAATLGHAGSSHSRAEAWSQLLGRWGSASKAALSHSPCAEPSTRTKPTQRL